MSIPDAIKELAKHGITVSKQSIHARIKRKTINSKLIGKKKKYVDFKELLAIYSKKPLTNKPISPPKVVHKVEHTTSEPYDIKPLTKDELKKALIHMQMKIKEMAIGSYTTESTTYRIRIKEDGNEIETPIKKVVTSHLPKLEYIRAFATLSVMIDELEKKSDVGETNEQVLNRYRQYIEGIGGKYQEAFD